MMHTKNPGILEAIKELRIMNLGKYMRLRYEAHMKFIRDRNARDAYVREEGRLQGQAEGRLQGQAEWQRNLIQQKRARGESDETIALALEITPEHIREIMDDQPS